VRIAAHRSTTTASANVSEANTKPAGSSFLEVLTGTSAQSSQANSAAISGAAQHAGSETKDEKQQGFDHSGENQPRTKSAASQNSLTPTSASSPAVKPPAPQMQPRTNSASSAHPAERDEKSNQSQPDTIANIIPLPANASAQIVPVPVTPVPSPDCTGQSAGGNRTQVPQPAAAPSLAADNHAVCSAHVSGSISDKLTSLDGDAGAEPAQLASDLSIQASPSGDQTSGSTEHSTDANSTVSASTSSASTSPAAQSISSAAAAQSSAILSAMASLPSVSAPPTNNPAPGSKAADQNRLKGVVAGDTSTATGNNQPTVNGSAHAAQDNAQGSASAQHTQSQAGVQTAPAAQGPDNAAASQMQSVAVHAPAHDAAAPHSHADGPVETARAATQTAPAESNETAATQAINTANVIQKMSETEMRVGMHSAEFGEISIRTSVSQQQMVAQISVDHGDLGKAISAHIPGMEARLGNELGLRALVQVSQSGMSFSGERGYSPQREQSTYAQPVQVDAVPGFVETDNAVLRVAASSVDGYRLDIQA
jgi:hypothetical protein